MPSFRKEQVFSYELNIIINLHVIKSLKANLFFNWKKNKNKNKSLLLVKMTSFLQLDMLRVFEAFKPNYLPDYLFPIIKTINFGFWKTRLKSKKKVNSQAFDMLVNVINTGEWWPQNNLIYIFNRNSGDFDISKASN